MYVMTKHSAMGADSVIDKIPTRKVGSALAVFHGYRRTSSLGWALVWGVLGYAAPVVTNVVAVAQGFGAKRSCP